MIDKWTCLDEKAEAFEKINGFKCYLVIISYYISTEQKTGQQLQQMTKN